MIQAQLTKFNEAPKARMDEKKESNKAERGGRTPQAFQSKVKPNDSHKSSKSEFKNELKALLSKDSHGEHEKNVDETELNSSSKASDLVESQNNLNVKIFNPSLTQDVEKALQSESSIVDGAKLDLKSLNDLSVENLDFSQAPELEAVSESAPDTEMILNKLISQSSAKPSRSPAIDLNDQEVDMKFMNSEDFLMQKNASKKSISNAYGMKTSPEQLQNVNSQKIMEETGLKHQQIISESSASGELAQNSQQFILGLKAQGSPEAMTIVHESGSSAKVFDMGQMKSSQAGEVLNQITDYVIQAKAAKEPTVSLKVNPQDLGLIDITVTKIHQQQEGLAIQIGAHSIDGKAFFQQHSKELLSHLSHAGLNISDLKIETPTQTAKNDFDFSNQSGRQNQSGSEKQFGSEHNQRRHDSERRQDLWKIFNKEAA
jgi:hypothetical protein